MAAKRRTLGRRARDYALRAARAVAVLVLLVGMARAGSRYFYCPLMDAVLSASCCEHEKDSRSGEQREFARTDCCQGKSIPALPSVSGAAPTETLHAPLLAVLAPPSRVHARPVVSLLSSQRSECAARSSPPSAARAELMVFLI